MAGVSPRRRPRRRRGSATFSGSSGGIDVLGRQLLEHPVLHPVVAGVALLVRQPPPHQVQAGEDPERLEVAVLARARVGAVPTGTARWPDRSDTAAAAAACPAPPRRRTAASRPRDRRRSGRRGARSRRSSGRHPPAVQHRESRPPRRAPARRAPASLASSVHRRPGFRRAPGRSRLWTSRAPGTSLEARRPRFKAGAIFAKPLAALRQRLPAIAKACLTVAPRPPDRTPAWQRRRFPAAT